MTDEADKLPLVGSVSSGQQGAAPLTVFAAPATGDEFNTLGERLVPKACFKVEDLLFDFDSSFVRPEIGPHLPRLAQLRTDNKVGDLFPPLSIFGHADPVGNDDDNKKLSGRRATAIYAMLIRDVDLWEDLFSKPVGHDDWGTRSIQMMLSKVQAPIGIDGKTGDETRTAIKTFQSANGLGADGVAGPATRKVLFLAYMDALCGPDLALDKKEDFLARNADSGGKGDRQGCSEFNPLLMFSKDEAAAFERAADKTERNLENAPNRRVMILLFAAGRRVKPGIWPCPRVSEGVADCKKRFFPDAATRRSFQDDRREFDQTKDTFACRFYQIISDDSPCERVNPTPVPELVNPQIAFTGTAPDADRAPAAATPGRASALVAAPVGVGAVTASRDFVIVKKPHTFPDRVIVTLKTDKPFDGTGTFTRSNPRIKFFADSIASKEITFNGRDNVFKGADLTAGFNVLAEGFQGSKAVDDVTLTLTLSGGVKKNGPPATRKMTSVDVTLDICSRRTSASADPPALSQAAKITPGRTIHVQNPANQRLRAMLIVRPVQPKGFTQNLTLSPGSSAVQIFRNETPPATGVENPLGDPFVIDPSTIPATGLKLFAQGAKVSGAFRDTPIRLGIQNLDPDADHVIATVIKAQLDICPARDTAGVVPTPLTQDDKLKVGRFVHVQDPGSHQGRAMLIVQQVKPADWTGTLLVAPFETSNPRVTLFQAEVAAVGQAPLANPHRVTHNASFPAAGQQLFAQGARVSAPALRDTGFKLGILDVEDECDRVNMTVVRLKNLKADVPSTPANTARLGNSPVQRHTLTRAGGAIASADHDESFNANPPLVLVEDSVGAADPVKLSVEVEPAGVPVLWSVQRDTRAAPNGDHPDIVALSPRAIPSFSPVPGKPLEATLIADAVGSFHVRPFVDTNKNATFNGDNASNVRVDREPNVILNLVLVRVQQFANASIARQANVRLIPAAPTANTGVQVSTGGFANPRVAGIHNNGTVDVIGGGGDGLRGLDRLFAGWVNNELASPGSPTVPPTEDGVATYTDPTPPNATHPRFTVWVQPPAHTGFQTFRPGPPPPPAFTIQPGPVLDTTNFGREGTGGNRCVGTEGRVGPPVPINKTARPRPAGGGNLGQRWRIEMWDSPGDSAPRRHEGFAAARLTAYRFNLDFRSDLVFWTNITRTPNPTPDAACRLYSKVLTNTWTIRTALTFNAAGASTIAQAPTITMTPEVIAAAAPKRAVPVAGTGLEVRAPISLRLLIVDATT